MARLSEREFEAFQAFVLSSKLYWTREIFADLKGTYEAKLANGLGAGMRPGRHRVAAILAGEAVLAAVTVGEAAPTVPPVVRERVG